MVFYYILINFVAYLIFQEGFSCANVIIIKNDTACVINDADLSYLKVLVMTFRQ